MVDVNARAGAANRIARRGYLAELTVTGWERWNSQPRFRGQLDGSGFRRNRAGDCSSTGSRGSSGAP